MLVTCRSGQYGRSVSPVHDRIDASRCRGERTSLEKLVREPRPTGTDGWAEVTRPPLDNRGGADHVAEEMRRDCTTVRTGHSHHSNGEIRFTLAWDRSDSRRLLRFSSGRDSSWCASRGLRDKDTGLVKQARAVATRHQLVAAAAAAFDQRGFEGASLGDIIEAGTGLSKGALYFHFKSKEELADAVVQRQHEISLAAVEAIAATHASALEQIVMLCHEMGRQIVQDPIVRAGIRLTLEFSGGGGPLDPAGPYRDWIEACRQLAETAIAEGDLPGTVDAPELARFVISAFTGVQMVSNVLDRRVDLEQRIDQMWRFLLPGIMVPARRRKCERIRQARWSRKQKNVPIPAS